MVGGYHTVEIPKGTFGELDKIYEEIIEALDAEKQGSKVMVLIELSDLVGAVQGYLDKYHPSLGVEDLLHMAQITSRAFEVGERK